MQSNPQFHRFAKQGWHRSRRTRGNWYRRIGSEIVTVYRDACGMYHYCVICSDDETVFSEAFSSLLAAKLALYQRFERWLTHA